MTGIQAVVFVNAISHVGATLRYRRYSPGPVTAVLLNLPFSLVFFRRMLASDHLSWGGLLMAVALARGALEAGRALVPSTRRQH
jgi:hypothetical protein